MQAGLLDAHVRLGLVLSAALLPHRLSQQLQPELARLFELSTGDDDEWVRLLARGLAGGHCSAQALAEELPSVRLAAASARSLRRVSVT